MLTSRNVIRDLRSLADPKRVASSAWFFKTGAGEYGAGDRFLGVRVPDQRRIARRHRVLSLPQVATLLRNPFHEARLTAVLILCEQAKRASPAERQRLAAFYLRHARQMNNWDLVDTGAPTLLGRALLNRPRGVLRRLARSQNLWERRIAIIATQAFIREGQFDDTLAITTILLRDPHDLIQKAVGWMLREVGNRDRAREETILRRFATVMPRTMLRNAIEKFPRSRRRAYLAARS